MSDDELEFKRLWSAVLTGGLDDFASLGLLRRPATSKKMIQHAAKNWLFSAHNEIGSFTICCHIIGIDPAAMRDRISRLGELRLKKILARVHFNVTLYHRHSKGGARPIGRPRKISIRGPRAESVEARSASII